MIKTPDMLHIKNWKKNNYFKTFKNVTHLKLLEQSILEIEKINKHRLKCFVLKNFLATCQILDKEIH